MSSKLVHRLPHWLPAPCCIDTLSDLAALDQFEQRWKDARYMPWRFCYMDYEVLQKEMTTMQDSWTISSRLQDEWIRIYDFYMLKRGEIDRRIMSFQEQKRCTTTTTLSATFQSLTLEIFQLYRFAKLNYCGFLSILMRYDSANDADLRKVVVHKPFWTHAMEFHKLAIEANYLYMTSSLVSPYSISSFFFFKTLQQDCTKAETDDKGSHVALPQQQANINNHAIKRDNSPLAYSPLSCSIHSCETTLSSEICLQSPPTHQTYWLHPNNMLQVMLYLSDKMMVTAQDGKTPAVNEVGYYSGRHHTLDNQYKVTTLYMDTPQLSGYTQRVNAGELQTATPMTRVRWHDSTTRTDTNSTHVMIEQKVRNQKMVQQRVWLKSKHLQPWLSGSFSLGSILSKDSCQYHTAGYAVSSDDVIHNMKASCLSMEHQVHTNQIQPVLQVSQNRIVYVSMDHSVTISIDSDISMVRAYTTGLSDSSDGIVRFPYCVVGISTSASTDDAENQWFMKLMKCGMLMPVDGFSTYLHGVGMLFKDLPSPDWMSVRMNDTGFEHLLIQGQTPPHQHGKQGISPKSSLDSIQTTSGESNTRSSSSSSSSSSNSSSRDTIATIITCYDDDLDEKQPQPTEESPIHTTTHSPLLHPEDGYFRQQGRSGMRRSFDSYCSFDHPSSSRSDPTNCKSCMGRMLFNEQQQPTMHDGSSSSHSLPIVSFEKETITFSSFLLQTFWPRKFRSFEKEPLLVQHHHHRKYRSFSSNSIASCHSNHCSQITQPLPSSQPAASPGETFSRAAILTMTCVVMSLSMSCILYITVLTNL
ncbi:hypothetical protein PS15p_201718 [Mucor circinelloides]